MSSFLEGDNVKPTMASHAAPLKGKVIQYLTESDVDRSGRGYFFPRVGVVHGHVGKNLGVNGDYIPFSRFVEVVVLRDATQEEINMYEHEGDEAPMHDVRNQQ